MKQFYKFTVVGITGLFLGGCSLFPSAWKSTRSGGETQPAPTAAITVAPTQTVEELDQSVTSDLDTPMDADLQKIDEDLKTVDQDLKNY